MMLPTVMRRDRGHKCGQKSLLYLIRHSKSLCRYPAQSSPGLGYLGQSYLPLNEGYSAQTLLAGREGEGDSDDRDGRRRVRGVRTEVQALTHTQHQEFMRISSPIILATGVSRAVISASYMM